MESKIVCRNISKVFIQKGTQRVHVLEDISVDVKQNEFVVILGPGQSGKSTLLRIIAGLETPTTGTVSLDGKRSGGARGRSRAGVPELHALPLEDGAGQRGAGAEA